MPDIDIRRTHQLGLAGARAAADKMAEHLARRFDLKGAWEGDVLRFERPGVNGTLAISGNDVHLAVTLGFLLRALRGTIEQAVHGEMDRLFAAAPPPRSPANAPATPPKARKPAAPRKKGG